MTEQRDLYEKISSLQLFITDPEGIFHHLHEDDQDLMKAQLTVMKQYYCILSARTVRASAEYGGE